MKNLKKVLALVLVFSMLLSVVAFASYPDVEEGEYYTRAVEALSAFGVVKGDDQGNFNPDATITRAEVAAIVLRIMGYEDSALAAVGPTKFDDVADDHWATGYINLASQLGIIVGNGDGTFNPEGDVTYQEAVKMIVCALGHEYFANQKGGWPTGYLVVGNSNKLNKDIPTISGSDKAPRSIVAMLAFNALDVYLAEESYSGNGGYVVCNGKNDTEEKTLLTTNLGFSKLAGMVVANEKTDMTVGGTPTEVGFVKYQYTDCFKSTDDILIKSEGKTNTIQFATGNTNASDTLGMNTIAYVKNISNKKYEIVYIALDDDSASKVLVDAGEIDTDSARTKDNKVAYFATENATKSTQLTIANSLTVITNNESETVTAASFITMYKGLLDTPTTLEFVDNDGDDIYDVVTIKKYIHVLVKSVDTVRETITPYNGNKFSVNTEDDDKVVTIKDVNGKEVDLDDIGEWDVLAIVCDAAKPVNATVLDITVLDESSVVEGKVSGRNPSKAEYTIDSVNYKLAADIVYGPTPVIGTEGKFFLDITGKIFAVDTSGQSTIGGNYGLIVEAGEDTGLFGKTSIYVRLITSDGKDDYYNLATKVKTIGNSSYDSDPSGNNAAIPASKFEDTPWEDIANATSWRKVFTDNMFVNDTITDYDAQNARFVKYTLNSNGEINMIMPAKSGKDTTVFNYNNDSTPETYYEGANRLGSKYLSDNTAVFFIPESGKLDKATVKNSSALSDGSKYTATFFDIDSSSYYGAVLVKKGEGAFSKNSSIGIVTSVSVVNNDDDDQLTMVKFLKDGSNTESVVYFDDDSDVYDGSSDVDDLDVGSIFIYLADDTDTVSSYCVIGTIISNGVNTTFDLDSNANDFMEENGFYFGYVTDNSKSRSLELEGGNISTYNGTNKYTFSVDSNANEYLYNNSNPRRITVTADGYEGPDFYSEPEEIEGKDTKASLVLVRLVEDIVTDIYGIASPYIL